jgi:hypothetical protein
MADRLDLIGCEVLGYVYDSAHPRFEPAQAARDRDDRDDDSAADSAADPPSEGPDTHPLPTSTDAPPAATAAGAATVEVPSQRNGADPPVWRPSPYPRSRSAPTEARPSPYPLSTPAPANPGPAPYAPANGTVHPMNSPH